MAASPDIHLREKATVLGWILAGNYIAQVKSNRTQDLFGNNSNSEFETRCCLEVPGITNVTGCMDINHVGFKNQLLQVEDGRYSIRLLWGENMKELPVNLELMKARLRSITKHLLTEVRKTGRIS